MPENPAIPELIETVKELLLSYENVGGESDAYLLAVGKLAELMGIETEELIRPKNVLARKIAKTNRV